MYLLRPPGSYQCVAENEVGVAYSDVVSVRRAVMAYVPKQEPRVVTANLGRPLRLDCEVPAGHPSPSVQWFMQVGECVGCAALQVCPGIAFFNTFRAAQYEWNKRTTLIGSFRGRSLQPAWIVSPGRIK